MIIKRNINRKMVNSKHFGVVDKFRAMSQMPVHRLINPGTMLVHTNRYAPICFANVLFSAAWTLNLVDYVGTLFKRYFVLCRAEEPEFLALVAYGDTCVLLEISTQFTYQAFDEGFALFSGIWHAEPD